MQKVHIAQGIQKVPKGHMYPKGSLRSQVSKRYMEVNGIQKVPKGVRYPKGTSRTKESKRYQRVQGIQKVPKGSLLRKTIESLTAVIPTPDHPPPFSL